MFSTVWEVKTETQNVKVYFVFTSQPQGKLRILELCLLVWCHRPLTCPATSTTDNWEPEDLTRWPAEPSHSHYCSVPPVEKVSDGINSVAFRAQNQSDMFWCKTRLAPVFFTCSRADLCRTASPGGPGSAIALATARATEVGPRLCGFLHNFMRHIHQNVLKQSHHLY